MPHIVVKIRKEYKKMNNAYQGKDWQNPLEKRTIPIYNKIAKAPLIHIFDIMGMTT